jgi:hypothetical protein
MSEVFGNETLFDHFLNHNEGSQSADSVRTRTELFDFVLDRCDPSSAEKETFDLLFCEYRDSKVGDERLISEVTCAIECFFGVFWDFLCFII